MADSASLSDPTAAWTAFAERFNESMADAMRQNVSAQTQFWEAWYDALAGAGAGAGSNPFTDGMDGYARAYATWMEAVDEQFDRVFDAARGDDVAPEDFRNIWLSAANEAFQDVMSTTDFARSTGESIDDALEFRRDLDETAEETLHSLGFATGGDVEEVGSRLVELERRQQAVEENLERILDAVDESE